MIKPTTKVATAVVRCLNLYIYNQSGYDAIMKLFPNCTTDYANEKVELWLKGLTAWMGCLDYQKQTEFVQMAMDKYWDEVTDSYTFNDD